MALVLVALPFVCLLGAGVTWYFGRLRHEASGYIASIFALIAFFCAVILSSAVYDPTTGYAVRVSLFSWFDFMPGVRGGLITWALAFDRLSAVMCLLVTGVGFLVHVFSIGYMRNDDSRPRYFAYLNLFLFSMLVLVLGANLLVTFVGWELVGLASYLLIGFWYKDTSTSAAGRKAFVMNRIGDAGFLIAIFALALLFGTLDYEALRVLLFSDQGQSFITSPVLVVAAAGIFFAAVGKSAQLPLFTWLPDAMAGPTPVSALIHAATMVTAGVYLCTRMGFMLELVPGVQAIILAVAMVTALIASLAALFQRDLKAVLAYSTVSQLAIMFIAVGLGYWWLAIFHLLTHGFFKACLFLCAGAIIDANHHEQDIAKLGGLRRRMPVTCVCFLFSALALSAIFPFAGYFSEHGIMVELQSFLHQVAGEQGTGFGVVVLLSPLIALITPLYMGRLFGLVFLGLPRSPHAENAKEVGALMLWPLVILAGFSLLAGILLIKPLPGYLETVLIYRGGEIEFNLLHALKHSIPALLIFLIGIFVFTQKRVGEKLFVFQARPDFKIFQSAFFFDRLYGWVFVRGFQKFAGMLLMLGENLLVNSLGLTTAAFAQLSGVCVSALQTGKIRHMLLMIFAAFVLFLSFCILM
jgi:NADH-quinone oxidoreductase subunit L